MQALTITEQILNSFQTCAMVVGDSPLLEKQAETLMIEGKPDTIKVSWPVPDELGTHAYYFLIRDLEKANIKDDHVYLLGSEKDMVMVKFYKLSPVKIERVPLDINQNALSAGDEVVCVDDKIGGDSDNEEDFDFYAGKKYEIDSVVDEDNLISPMICIKGSQNGPVFSERFVKYIEHG
jgi:hypothetical protein